MIDLVVTVPKDQWSSWIIEGDLPGDVAQYESHFWIRKPAPFIAPGCRVYIVAHGRLRGYAPLVRVETSCQLNSSKACLVREGGAVAVTIAQGIRGFQGVRRRWWNYEEEMPFPDFAAVNPRRPAGGPK